MYRQRGSIENEMALSILVVFAVGAILFVFSRWLGADFGVTAYASLRTLASIVVFLGAMYFFKVWMYFLEGLLAWAALTWFFWWGVLDNIAQKLFPAQSLLWEMDYIQLPWWDTSWFKWGVEIALWIILGVLVYYRNSNHRYSYY